MALRHEKRAEEREEESRGGREGGGGGKIWLKGGGRGRKRTEGGREKSLPLLNRRGQGQAVLANPQTIRGPLPLGLHM